MHLGKYFQQLIIMFFYNYVEESMIMNWSVWLFTFRGIMVNLQQWDLHKKHIKYNFLIDGKKCSNKEERVRHLPGYCP